MAFSWHIDSPESVEWDEFIEYFASQGQQLFEGHLDDDAMMMRRIANNRHFLVSRINQELVSALSLGNFQAENLYTAQTFILSRHDFMVIRVNIWEPRRNRPGESIFYYDDSHDHNFAFLTVGYLGTGYATRIYEYDHARTVGYDGEPVALKFLEETKLPAGKVMFFRESVDVHTQLPPDDFSISVNVLRPAPRLRDQYAFDLAQQSVKGKIGRIPLDVLIRVAGAAGDDDVLGTLLDLARSHECRHTRIAAFEAVAARQGAAVWEHALDDSNELVRRAARQSLRQAER